MKRLLVLSAILSLVACGGGGGSGTTTLATGASSQTCSNNTAINAGEYTGVVSSPGAFGTTVSGTSCISITNLGSNAVAAEFSFNYPVPDVTRNPVTWSSVLYGDKYGQATANHLLPALYSNIHNFAITYDVSSGNVAPTGGGSLFLEFNLTKTASNNNDINVSIDIDLNTWGARLTDPAFNSATVWRKDTFHLPVVTIDNVQYYLQVDGAYSPTGKLPISFTRVDFASVPNERGSVNIKSFMDYLIANNIIPNTLYVSGMELGVEVDYGIGNIKVNNYSITAN